MSTTNSVEMATFDVNEHGRLLGGNKRFCRMFGFESDEVSWHYITDLCRHAKDWESFMESDPQTAFEIRMKNRKGRSFFCKLVRETVQNESGEIIYRNMLCRKSETIAIPAANSLSLVFLGRCGQCGKQIRVNTAAEARMRMLCDDCAAMAYPEAFHAREGQM